MPSFGSKETLWLRMYRRQKSDTLQFLGVAALVVAADQLSKQYIATHFLPGESRLVIPGLLRWTYEQNQHGAFGLFGDSPALLIIMAVLVLAVFWLSFRDQA